MELYLAQKVHQALEALCEDKPLKKRLQLASIHLAVVDSPLSQIPLQRVSEVLLAASWLLIFGVSLKWRYSDFPI
jgi:hypothetical protein